MKDQAMDDYIGSCELIAHTLNNRAPRPQHRLFWLENENLGSVLSLSMSTDTS